MNDQGLIITLSDLRSARLQERRVLEELEMRLESQINYAIHSASDVGADENFVRMALPTLLLSIAARYFLDMKEHISNPHFPDDFALLANQSIDWACDRNSLNFSSSH